MPSMKRPTYTEETIHALVRRFDDAPPAPKAPEPLGAPALVRKLAPKLREMTRKGYSWQAIAGMMAEDGVTIAPNVLRKYVSEAAPQAKSKKKTKGGPRTLHARPDARPSAAPTDAQAPSVARTEELAASDDAWDELQPVEETDLPPERAPSGALPRAASVKPVQEPRKVPSSLLGGTSTFRIRPDTENL